MQDEQVLRMILQDEVLIPSLVAGSVIIIVALRTFGGVMRTFSKERSRREIAAFIAEGSMTPEQGERLLKAGESRSCS